MSWQPASRRIANICPAGEKVGRIDSIHSSFSLSIDKKLAWDTLLATKRSKKCQGEKVKKNLTLQATAATILYNVNSEITTY
jgi:hypothetical protein